MTQAEQATAERDRQLFDRIATTYARKDLYEPSQTARRMRLFQTLRVIPDRDDIDMLEVGCGAGYSARYLAGRYASFVGIDHSEELIKYARTVNALPSATFEVVDFVAFQPARQFDVVFMIGVLHHMVDIPEALRAAHALLKPGGYLVANEPQSANPFIQGLRAVRAAVDPSYSKDQIQLGEGELTTLLGKAGFVDVKTMAQGYCSTPFAEVMLKPRLLALPLSRVACGADAFLERSSNRILKRTAWNLVAAGRKES